MHVHITQDARQRCLFMNLSLNNSGDSPWSVGGNINNSYLEYDEEVSLFKAVMGHKKKLCDVGDYVAYCGQEGVS